MVGERDIRRRAAPDCDAPAHRRNPLGADGYRDDAHAVVIGINQYRDPTIPDLRYARADAEAVYRVLTDPAVGRFRPGTNSTLLLDDQATERRIREVINDELPRRVAPDDTVVVYFAGHGAPVIDLGAGAADGVEKYLLPHDAVADRLRASAISMDAIAQYFRWIGARQVVFFLDSCYSGGAGGRAFEHPAYRTRAALSDEFLEHLGSEGRLVVTACAANEVSLETPEKGHGLFTYHLVRGLGGAADADGHGLVTVDALYDYVYSRVEADARALGGRMRPVRKGAVQGRVYLTQYATPGAGTEAHSAPESPDVTVAHVPVPTLEASRATAERIARSGPDEGARPRDAAPHESSAATPRNRDHDPRRGDTRTPRRNDRMLLVGGSGAVLAALLAAVVLKVSHPLAADVYRVRATVVDRTNTPVEDAHVWSDQGGEGKRVAGGWEFDVPAATASAEHRLVVRAARASAFETAVDSLRLGPDANPSLTLRLRADTSATVRGTVFDAQGRALAGARVSVDGYGREGTVTDPSGGFVLPAHVADGQQVLLRAEKPGVGVTTLYHIAGRAPAALQLDHAAPSP